jgi:hypothetical protein
MGDQIRPSFKLDRYGTNKRLGWTNPPAFIDFSPEIAKEIWDYSQRFAETTERLDFYRASHDDLVHLREPLRSTLHAFFVDLWTWEQATARLGPEYRRWMSPTEIFIRSIQEGPSYAKWMADLKKAVMHMIGDCRVGVDELQKKYATTLARFKMLMMSYRPNFQVKKGVAREFGNPLFQIGDLYRENSLFHWRPPNLEWDGVVNTPVIQDEEMMERFRKETREYLHQPDKAFLTEIPWETRQEDDLTACREGQNVTGSAQRPATMRGRSVIAHIPRE